MPNFELKNQPKYPLLTIETNEPISESKIEELLNDRQGATLCVRSNGGHEKRGGYFFCIEKTENDFFRLLTIESVIIIDSIPLEKLAKLINHAAGLAFDKDMLQYCQNEINFRED